MTDERPTFGAAEVIEIASKFEVDDAAFIIGGQATNFWAWFFQDKEPDLKLKGPFTSEDIDYFGSRDVARNVAAALGGELLVPDIDDFTPNTAQIRMSFHGKPLVIDFLGGILGVHEREIRRGVSVLEVQGEIDGRPTIVLIKVMHPLLCLKSRIINMVHPSLGRHGTIARTQAEAALIIVRRFIHDTLDDDDHHEAKECFRTLFRYLRSDEYVKVADLKLGLDPLNIIRTFVDDKRIDSRYRGRQLKQMVAKIEERRANRR
jgi:hypothetical protein